MSIAPWRATCVQMKSELASKASSNDDAKEIIARNVERAVGHINQICDGPNPAKLVLLPEFALQGPPLSGESVEQWIAKACDTLPGSVAAPFQEIAAKRNIFIGGNLFEFDPKWPGRFFNSCFLIDNKGEVILRFRRINTAMWPSPHDFIDAYQGELGIEGVFPVVDTELGKLAMVACGEIQVPEVVRAFMVRGAEVLIHPTNEDLSPGQEAAKIARAAENMMYVISANVAGGIGFSPDGSVLGGRSRIVDFRGKTLSYEPEAHETIGVSAMIDVEALRKARRELSMANGLLRTRWEMYRDIYANLSVYPPNYFLATPMAHYSMTELPVKIAMENLIRLGITVEA